MEEEIEKVTKEEEKREGRGQGWYVSSFNDFGEYIKKFKLTPIEKMMAVNLLSHGYEFFIQEPIDLPEGWTINGVKFFVADFLILDHYNKGTDHTTELNLIIETDGKVHFNPENQNKDRNRDNILTSMGYKILRFDWDDVFANNENFDIFILIDNFTQLTERTDRENAQFHRESALFEKALENERSASKSKTKKNK